MRKLSALTVAFVLVLAFFVVGSPPANAFGSEVLGCAFDSSQWTDNACTASYQTGHVSIVHFTLHNVSGNYDSRAWTLTQGFGVPLTSSCDGVTFPCIYSGCTSSFMTCDVQNRTGPNDRYVVASLQLTQSGQSRTYVAQATLRAGAPV
jgi:hypothetical protein